VFMLSKYECLHLFPVPSTMAGKMREALYPSGAKDDPRDADLLLDLLLQHRNKLRRLSPDTEASRRVQNLVEERRKLIDEKTEQINRLTSHLKIYFPQMLDWFDRLDREAVYALLERWPTLQEWQEASAAKLRMFFSKHHCRDQEVIERRIVGIRQAVPAIRDRAVIEAKSAVVKVIAQLIRILVQGIAELDRKIEDAAAAHPDFFIFDSLPGAGPALAPRLLAAFGSQRGRFGSAQEIQAYSGIAPVIERSGKRSGYISDGPRRSFFGKAFMSGLGVRLRNRPGRALTTSSDVNVAKRTTPQFGHWRSNGSVSHSDAGRIMSLMMRADI